MTQPLHSANANAEAAPESSSAEAAPVANASTTSDVKLKVGVIGKRFLTPAEKTSLWMLGRIVARLGHDLQLIPTKGTANQMRDGFELEGRTALELTAGVIEASDVTLIYPDERLLKRIEKMYPDYRDRADVRVLYPEPIEDYVAAAREILKERGIPQP